MYDFIRAVCAVPKLKVGDTVFNTDEIIKKIRVAEDADIIVFPELCTTGYTCADLFFQSRLQQAASEALQKIVTASEGSDKIIFIGSPLCIDGQLYNCAVCIFSGKICGIVPKTIIPNYNEFYEMRWFSSAEQLQKNEISATDAGISGDYTIPVGNDIIFEADGVKIGCEICEDLWSALPPSTLVALGGAEVIVNLSASNETISKRNYRRSLVTQQSARCLCAYVYTSAGSDESTTDLVFSGHSLIAENGSLAAENKNTIDNDYLLACDIDLGKIKTDRLKIKSFRESAAMYASVKKFRTIHLPKKGFAGDGSMCRIAKLPFVPETETERLERCRDIFEMQAAGLGKRLSAAGGKLIIGVSGGLDSTLALLVCAQTMKKAGRPLTDVVGITMPCFGTSGRTYSNSLELMKTLGVTAVEINIKDACLKHFSDIGHDENVYDLTYENSQARERTQVLMDYAGKVGGFVVGTGDLSELALGWCTYNADHMSMYGVNSGIPKTLVRWMVDSVIKYNLFPESTEVLKDIIDTPISPELLPPDAQGKIAQETESIIGPYALHDFFLYYAVRFGFTPKKVFRLAEIAFKNDFDRRTILKWLKSFYKRFFSQQFKRSCLPDGIKIGSICLSPRGDWRMPSDASPAVWLQEVQELEQEVTE